MSESIPLDPDRDEGALDGRDDAPVDDEDETGGEGSTAPPSSPVTPKPRPAPR